MSATTLRIESMKWIFPAILTATAILGLCRPGLAHDVGGHRPIVIDTDMGIDDLVAVSMALQLPDIDVHAVVAGEGVADITTAQEQLDRVLDYFNRPDVQLFRAAAYPEAEAPPWRVRARTMIDAALPPTRRHRPTVLSALQAYTVKGEKTTVVVLGPLTSLAAALASDPSVTEGIARIVVAADPDAEHDWNLDFDRRALATVRASGVPLLFVSRGNSSMKPEGWYTKHLSGGQGTSLGESLLDRLLAKPAAREHYLKLGFCDELAVLSLVEPQLFSHRGSQKLAPEDEGATAAAIANLISRGRQRKERVVFSELPLPDSALQPDVRARRAEIQKNNGADEWFAELLLNELHEHLGAYSIIGVKMGLRAAELLNAPQHAMSITSATPSTPPVSCLNDGLLVATGSTPGRGLFRQLPGAPGAVEASFSYNGRNLTLRLKEEYRRQIRSAIGDLLSRWTLEDDEYWAGVRKFGLDIWETWHRRELFEVVVGSDHDEQETLIFSLRYDKEKLITQHLERLEEARGAAA